MPNSARGRVLLSAAGVLGAASVTFGAIAPPERCPDVDTGAVRSAATEAVGWFVRNQNQDGTWLYAYDADTDTVIDDYNTVRHAGAVMGLYQAASAGVDGALASADRGVAWAMGNVVEQDGWAAVAGSTGTLISAGATALLTAGLVERRELTGDAAYDEDLRRFGAFLAGQVEPSGAYLAYYDLGTMTPVPGEYSKYYTGEAYWALARLHLTFPGEDWGDVADRVGEYIATERDEREDNWPAIPDHWAAYGLAETVAFPERDSRRDEGIGGVDQPLTTAEVDYARQQAGSFGAQVRWVSQRFGPWGRLVRGAAVPRGGGYGVIGEALTGWWRVSLEEERLGDLRGAIAERAACNAGLAIAAQSNAEESARYPNPNRVRGAWFRDGETRMDDQQHAISALLRTEQILESEPAGGTRGRAPSAWLLIAALVFALNPTRAGPAIPRAGRSPREVATVGVLGGMIGVVVAAALAWTSGPLLDALGVSSPAMRLGAGVVVAVAGVIDLVHPRAGSDPALPARRAALVPVAVPLVIRPALALLAISVGADRGVVTVVGAMAVGVLFSILAAQPPIDGVAGRALAWASRLVGAALIAVGVLLVVDAVLDV